MKKLLFILSLFVSAFSFAQDDKGIPARPSPFKLVNDLTGNTLTASQVQALDQKLRSYDDTTSTQIAVVIISTLDRKSLEDHAVDIGRKWGVGGKEFNNGIVILVAMKERKITIQTGYGMEGVVPDLTAKTIIDNSVIPHFKEKNYYRALDQATDDIIKVAEGKYKAPAGYRSKKKVLSFWNILVIAIILIIVFGAGSRGGGTYSSRRGFGGWYGGWGGGSSGGSSGGGWSGGGGSFGGGSFGGGGASGSW